MGKDDASLEKSREIRTQVIEKYGFVPTSLLFIKKDVDASSFKQEDYEVSQKLRIKYGCVPISLLHINYNWGNHVLEFEERKQHKRAQEKHKKMKYNIKSYTTQAGEQKSFNEGLEQFNMSSQNVRGKGGGLSTMPPMLVNFVVNFYSEPNDIVLDVCAGHNSRMQIVYENQHDYIGYDVSETFMEFNEKIKAQLLGESGQNLIFKPKNTITLRLQSSEHLLETDDSIGLVFTSPPYFRQEDYGDEPEQLGKSKTYGEFLLRIKQIIKECLRVLKPGKFCVFNVDDFRNGGVFFPFHADIMRIYQEVGFKLFDVGIVPWRGCIRACFASEIEKDKILGKAHEYIIVGQKPNLEPKGE